MQRSVACIRAWTLAGMFALLGTRLAKGDGGIVLLHEVRDPFSVTVFVAPESTRGGLADVSVLVQWRTNGQSVLDADVSLTLDPPIGSTMSQSDPVCGLRPSGAGIQPTDEAQLPMIVRATRAQAANKLLYAAPLNLSPSGDWRLHVTVSRGAVSAGFDCMVPAIKESANLAGLWSYLAFPPIAIGAFALNQKLRRHSLEQKT